MGRKPVPTSLKILRGNPGKRPLPENEPNPTAALPDPPEHLDETQRGYWFRFGEILLAAGVMTRLDAVCLEMLCNTYVGYCDAAAKEAQGGPVWVKAAAPGEIPKFAYSPFWVVKNKAWAQLMQVLTEFGMSPSSRSKVTVTEKKTGGIPTRQRA